MRLKLFEALIIAALMAVASIAKAEPSKTVSFAGNLGTEGGKPIPDGNYEVIFSIYNSKSDGEVVWSETQPSVSVINGDFEVILGNLTPLKIPGGEYWLSTDVKGMGTIPERLKVTVDYSISIAGREEEKESFPVTVYLGNEMGEGIGIELNEQEYIVYQKMNKDFKRKHPYWVYKQKGGMGGIPSLSLYCAKHKMFIPSNGCPECAKEEDK